MNLTVKAARRRTLKIARSSVFLTLGGGSPDWIIVGAMKAGTSSLHGALHTSPQAVAPSRKEVHFFDVNWGRTDEWYRSHFIRSGRLRTGEASPSYLFHPAAAERIASRLPDARLIVLLRDPVDRAYSHWGHQVRAGREPLSFTDALDAEPERMRGGDPDEGGSPYYGFSYLSRGLYADQLERLYGSFDRRQVMVLRAEDMFADFPRVVERTCDWLGLRAPATWRLRRRNVGLSRPPLDDRLRRDLAGYFAESNRRLVGLAGPDMHW